METVFYIFLFFRKIICSGNQFASLRVACQLKGFCGKWVGKGKSAKPHNFIKDEYGKRVIVEKADVSQGGVIRDLAVKHKVEHIVHLAVPGLAALTLFAFLLPKGDSLFAGRAYAAYGGVYIVASLGWLWAVEGMRPDRWDLTGAVVCVAGAAIILLTPRLA